MTSLAGDRSTRARPFVGSTAVVASSFQACCAVRPCWHRFPQLPARFTG